MPQPERIGAPPPQLAVIIPTLNEAAHLPALLTDLRHQQQLRLEVIIGDGGSVDATGAIAANFGARLVAAQRGRGAQMNGAAALAKAPYLLFLHADSRLTDPGLLSRALEALQGAEQAEAGVAGHFRLRFVRAGRGNTLSYRYLEEKTAQNRDQTTNGDQGLLLSRPFFDQLGGFDQSLPFLEDQRIGEQILSQGRWLTLPGELATSARRFESEGFHRRYLLMGIMMGLYSVGEHSFFSRAPAVYRVQAESGELLLWPFFRLLWSMVGRDWGLRGTLALFYRLGRYIRQNCWQLFFFVDVCLRPIWGPGRYPLLHFHDRVLAPIMDLKLVNGLVNALIGLLCFIVYLGLLAPFFWVSEAGGRWWSQRRRPHSLGR